MIRRSDQAYYALIALSSLFTLIGVSFGAVALSEMLVDDEEDEEAVDSAFSLNKENHPQSPSLQSTNSTTANSIANANSSANTPRRLSRASSLSDSVASRTSPTNPATKSRSRQQSLLPQWSKLSPREFEASLVLKDNETALTQTTHFKQCLVKVGGTRAKNWLDMTESDEGKNLELLAVPDKATPISVQAGGLSWKKRPFLFFPPDFVLKPLPSDYRGYRELGFYEKMVMAAGRGKDDTSSLDKETDLLRRYSSFMPSYYGLISSKSPNHLLAQDSYLLLRDTTATFSRPCVIDFKMGRQTYEPNCSLEKRADETKKYPEQATFGFRITGANIYDPNSPDAGEDGYVRYSKHFGRSLKNRAAIQDALLKLFSQTPAQGAHEEKKAYGVDRSERSRGRGGVRNRVVTEFRRQLKLLIAWFKSNNMFSFYASSILFVYEGMEGSDSWDNSRLRTIDFAHVVKRSDGARDDGYLDGLYTILRIVDEILRDQEKAGKLREDL
ncbi:hypothetical protein TrVE_jg10469 [Triparma verrucosa]|uniref:Kinase n=1 Tax=Triparma verrucosa TaxID=1606542 RepID=A0A9W7CE74_9STRA|nr:hypothetical protein TrVE_jg10469 [Triparma verrucosa]